MVADIETLVNHCINSPMSRRDPLKNNPVSSFSKWNIERNRWDRIHIDLMRPWKGKLFLVVVVGFVCMQQLKMMTWPCICISEMKRFLWNI